LIPINVIGVPASGISGLPLGLQELVLSAKMISGSKRLLEVLKDWLVSNGRGNALPDIFETNKTIELISWLKKRDKETVLLASGDPLWFGIGRYLLNHFPTDQLIFHPSTTSLQEAFARLGRPWQDAVWASLHGRDPDSLIKLLQKSPNAIGILTDPKKGGATEVRELLKSLDLNDKFSFWIFENLGHKKERVLKISPNEKIPELDPLHLVILIKEKTSKIKKKELPLFGLEDSFYSQYDDRPSLMTKREVRIQVLADLELPETGILWDIGAGIGSIGLEALRIRPKLKLLSIEKRLGGKELINANASLLSVFPAKVFEKEALDLLDKGDIPSQLKIPNRVVLGGGNSEKLLLLDKILSLIASDGIIVIPLATLEKLDKILSLLKERGCNTKISQHQAYRGVPLLQGTRLQPMNPVFIVKVKLK